MLKWGYKYTSIFFEFSMKFVRGFTLWEIIVVMAISVILARLTIPTLSAYTQQRRSDVIAVQIEDSFRYARSEAMRRNTAVTFCSATLSGKTAYLCKANKSATDWSSGMLSFVDLNGTGNYQSTGKIKFTKFESSTVATAVVTSSATRYYVKPDSTIEPLNKNGNICFNIVQKINSKDYKSCVIMNKYGNAIYYKNDDYFKCSSDC